MADQPPLPPVGKPSRTLWATRLGVILAVTGSAVGLGNFLRFPGVAVANGGGAFMIPYVVAFLVVGLPIAWIEWSMGRYAGRRGFNSAAGVYRSMMGGKSWAAYLGVLALIIPVIIYMYYLSVEAWCLGYAWQYWSGGMAETIASAQAAAAETAGAALEPAAAKEVAVSTANSYLVGFSGIPENFALANNFWTTAAPFVLICFVINFALIWRGLNKGIEWFCRWAMPALVLCAVLILVRVLTLGSPEGAVDQTVYHVQGSVEEAAVDPDQPVLVDADGTVMVPVTTTGSVSEGLGFMWNPAGHKTVSGVSAGSGAAGEVEQATAALTAHAAVMDLPADERPADHVDPTTKVVAEVSFIDALLNSQTWLAAAGQIFFSLSVGLGVIVTYASYTRRKDDIALSSVTAASGNGFFEIAIGGMLVIPAAIIFVPAINVVGAGEKASSLSLGFFALPGVFEHMPAGHFFGGLFFFLLFLAAVTSSLSMLQPAIAFLEEGLGIGRRASVAILGAITAFGAGFVALISSGLTVLDHMDFWMANFAIFLLALIQVLLFGWAGNFKKGLEELSEGAQMTLPRWLPFMLRFVTPAFLIIIFAVWLVQQIGKGQSSYFAALLENPTVQVTVLFMLAVAAFFTLLVHEAVRRWQAQEASGERPDPSADLVEGEV